MGSSATLRGLGRSWSGWGYSGGMPKVSVYLPDELYRKARERDLPLSALAQEAIEQALRRASLDEWIARERSRPRRMTHVIDTSTLMAQVRDDFGT